MRSLPTSETNENHRGRATGCRRNCWARAHTCTHLANMAELLAAPASQRVVLTDLHAQPELNGCVVVVERLDLGTGLYSVRMVGDGTQEMLVVRKHNLVERKSTATLESTLESGVNLLEAALGVDLNGDGDVGLKSSDDAAAAAGTSPDQSLSPQQGPRHRLLGVRPLIDNRAEYVCSRAIGYLPPVPDRPPPPQKNYLPEFMFAVGPSTAGGGGPISTRSMDRGSPRHGHAHTERTPFAERWWSRLFQGATYLDDESNAPTPTAAVVAPSSAADEFLEAFLRCLRHLPGDHHGHEEAGHTCWSCPAPAATNCELPELDLIESDGQRSIATGQASRKDGKPWPPQPPLARQREERARQEAARRPQSVASQLQTGNARASGSSGHGPGGSAHAFSAAPHLGPLLARYQTAASRNPSEHEARGRKKVYHNLPTYQLHMLGPTKPPGIAAPPIWTSPGTAPASAAPTSPGTPPRAPIIDRAQMPPPALDAPAAPVATSEVVSSGTPRVDGRGQPPWERSSPTSPAAVSRANQYPLAAAAAHPSHLPTSVLASSLPAPVPAPAPVPVVPVATPPPSALSAPSLPQTQALPPTVLPPPLPLSLNSRRLYRPRKSTTTSTRFGRAVRRMPIRIKLAGSEPPWQPPPQPPSTRVGHVPLNLVVGIHKDVDHDLVEKAKALSLYAVKAEEALEKVRAMAQMEQWEQAGGLGSCIGASRKQQRGGVWNLNELYL